MSDGMIDSLDIEFRTRSLWELICARPHTWISAEFNDDDDYCERCFESMDIDTVTEDCPEWEPPHLAAEGVTR